MKKVGFDALNQKTMDKQYFEPKNNEIPYFEPKNNGVSGIWYLEPKNNKKMIP